MPLSLVLLVLLTAPDEPGGGGAPQRAWELACFVLSLTGLAVRVLTVGFVPGKTSGRNVDAQVAATLNTTGMYSVVRHPLYLSAALLIVAISLVTANWFFPATGLMLFVLLVVRTRIEEENLVARFGESYQRYMERTGRFLPRIRADRPRR